MIRINIVGFNDSDSGAPRWGDSQIIDDGTNYVVVDGYTGTGKKKLLKRLKAIGCKTPYLYISHAHGDHDDGINAIINDSYFKPKLLGCYDPDSLKGGFGNSEIKSDAEFLRKIINTAKSRGIPVKYLKHGDVQVHGEIRFIVYREQRAYEGRSEDPHGWSYVNSGSLCFWFPNLGYWTSGDGSERIYDLCKKVGAKPKLIKIPHHGNNCSRSQAEGLYKNGCRYCWDNDYSTSINEFLRYGRGRCIEAGMRYIGIHGDINIVWHDEVGVIYKNGNAYGFGCSYNGKLTLKNASADVVRNIMRGKYGNGEDRITKLLDAELKPSYAQDKVNRVVSIAKGIKNGTMDYGKNEARIARIDKELGAGYGQLVQDYINVLYGVRKSV